MPVTGSNSIDDQRQQVGPDGRRRVEIHLTGSDRGCVRMTLLHSCHLHVLLGEGPGEDLVRQGVFPTGPVGMSYHPCLQMANCFCSTRFIVQECSEDSSKPACDLPMTNTSQQVRQSAKGRIYLCCCGSSMFVAICLKQ